MDDPVTVATFEDIVNAQIAVGRLEAEGIETDTRDSNFVQLDWLYSIALGGIKVQVERRDEIRAREVLETDHSADLDDLDLF